MSLSDCIMTTFNKWTWWWWTLYCLEKLYVF